jgi:hypothetical protein
MFPVSFVLYAFCLKIGHLFRQIQKQHHRHRVDHKILRACAKETEKNSNRNQKKDNATKKDHRFFRSIHRFLKDNQHSINQEGNNGDVECRYEKSDQDHFPSFDQS